MQRNLLFLFSAIIIAGAIVLTAYIKPVKPSEEVSASFSASQKGEVSTLVEKYIMEHPQTIVNSLQKMQREEEESKQQALNESVSQILPTIYADKTNPVLGNPDAKYTIVKLYDYACGYCKRMSKLLMDPVLANGNIRWIFVETPIFGETSDFAARIALAANKLGRFKEMHEALIDASELTKENIKSIAEKLGFSWEELEEIANSKEIKDKMIDNAGLAQQVGLRGVPLFIIDGRVIPGAFGQDVLDTILNDANVRAEQK
jgi:protein-disulfide isomerase